MAEDIRTTPLHKRTEVLSTVALAEQRKKSFGTCKSHIEQPNVQQPAPAPPTAHAISFKPTIRCWLCGNDVHVGRDCSESMHSSNSLRQCTNWQETGHYIILCTKLLEQQPPNTLNAIQCDICFGHHYGSECNKKTESNSVNYLNRTNKVIRTCHNISPMPEGSNQPDLNMADWLHDSTTLNDDQREMGNEGPCEQLYFRHLDGHSVQDAKFIDGFLYIYQESTWQLIIPRELQIKSMSAQNFFNQEAHDHIGHGGLYKTHQKLTHKYHWKHSYSNVKKCVESCQIWQVIKSATQKPVGLLTPLTVLQVRWIEIAMDFSFLKQLVVHCTKLIPSMKFSDKQKPDFVTFCKVLNIIDRRSGYTYMIRCMAEINAAGVVVIL